MKRILCLFMLAASLVLAQNATTAAAGEELVTVPKKYVAAQGLAEAKHEEVNKYLQMGEGVSAAIQGGLHAVTKETVDLSKTEVGKFIMVLVAWKVMGSDFLQIVVGIPLYLIGIAIFIWSWYKNCTSKKLKKSYDGYIYARELQEDGSLGNKGVGKEHPIKVVEEFMSSPDDGLRWAHAILLFVWCIGCTIVTFV